METLRPLGKGDTGNVLKMRELLNALVYNVNKLKGDSDGDGLGENLIPANFYPVSDGEGGFVEGAIIIKGSNTRIGKYDINLPVVDTGEHNILIKAGEAPVNTGVSGSGNIVIGGMALDVPGENNIHLGHHAGALVLGKNLNICIGLAAGGSSSGQQAVEHSIAIGNSARTTKNFQTYIGQGPNAVSAVPTEMVLRGTIINNVGKINKNSSTTLTADECLSGVIASTSVSAVTLTLPLAADLIAVLNAGMQGTTFDLVIDNSTGANSVTITPSATITAITSPFTITNPMIVTTAQKVGCFKFYFTSDTTAIVARVW